MTGHRDPETGPFVSFLDSSLKLATAVVGIYLVSRLVMPGRQTTAIIESMGAGFQSMVKVAVAERAIAERDIPRVETLLGEMTDDIMTELFAGLNDADLDWIESHLTMGME